MILSKPVVAAVDFSTTSRQVLIQAARIAKIEGVPLFVVHVVFPGLLPHRPGCRPSPKVIDNARLKAEQHLDELLGGVDLEISAEGLVVVGRPPDEIGQLIEREDAGLLVISANKPGQKRLGSIASRCVRTVPCDVMLVREKKHDRYQRIVACIDLSQASDPVMARAVEGARHGAALEVVHVTFPIDQDPGLCGEAMEEVADDRAFVEKGLSRVMEPYQEALQEISHKVSILESPVPSVALTCHAEDVGADLVVLGTRGHSKLGAMFFGTNAERLLHDVEASVLAVRI